MPPPCRPPTMHAPEFLLYAAVGALAQLVDGAMGMAYGVTAAAMLLGLGLPPAAATASVHYAETFTCGASGASHWLAGNVRRGLFLALAVPGVMGAVAGAYAVSRLPAHWLKLMLLPYLLGIGIFLLIRARRTRALREDVPPGTRTLGGVAGLLDAIGGGGWSALTVTQLMARGVAPRVAIGSAHLAKCVVSAAASISFLLTLGVQHGVAVLGIVVGGVISAPLGALLTRHMPARLATALAGAAVLALAINNAYAVLRH